MALSFALSASAEAPRPPVDEATQSVAEHESLDEHATSEGLGEHARSEGGDGHGEHGEDGEHGHAEEGEEPGNYIGKAEMWDATRNGARLILSFDVATDSFVGTVENTTSQTLCAVRVEVHMSTHVELGPTETTDLRPGEKTAVHLSADGETFESWTAHPEVSSCRDARSINPSPSSL